MATPLLAVSALLVGPSALAAYRSVQDERDAKAFARASQAHLAELEPAIALLRRLAAPTGLHRCPWLVLPQGMDPGELSEFVMFDGVVCLEGTGSPVLVAAAFARDLRRLGATGVAASCAEVPRSGPVCHLEATVAAQHLTLSVSRRSATVNGSPAPTTQTLLFGGLPPLDRERHFPAGSTPLPLPLLAP